MSQKSAACGTKGGYGSQLAKKIASGLNLGGKEDESITRLCLSQPEARLGEGPEEIEYLVDQDEVDHHRRSPLFSFSQPAARIDDFFLGSQLASTPGNTQSPPVSRWVKRMTRFCVTTTVDETVRNLTDVLDGLGYQWKLQNSHFPCVTVSTVDKRKNLLVYKAHVIEMGNKMVLLDFRLSRGDGLEFKRHFVRLKEKLNISEWKGPVAWLT
jgi:serine/threonine-protein kinase Chk1